MELPDLSDYFPALRLAFSPDSKTLYFGRETSLILSLELDTKNLTVTVGDILKLKDSTENSVLRDLTVSSW